LNMLRALGVVLLWSTGVWAGPMVSVTLLDGSTVSGEMTSLTMETVELQTPDGAEKIQAGSIMQLSFDDTVSTEKAAPVTAITVDQSQLQLERFTSDGTQATLVHAVWGEKTAPARQFSALRFAPLDDKISASWQDLRRRNTREDLLVIRKGDVLDYVAGSVGRVTAESVTVLARGKELSAPRERIFGIIFTSQPVPPGARRVAVRTAWDDTLQAQALALDNGSLVVTTSSLGDWTLPVDGLASIDFGGGRIRMLADLPVDQAGSKAPSENNAVVWFVSKNSPAGTAGKGLLRIGEKEYRRGLWLHSGAVLRYRLNREYSRLKATVGFELTHASRMPRFEPRVRLVITGDGRDLLRQEFSWNDPARPIDVDLKDVRELSIKVESLGVSQGVLEHFALGDAQVIQ